jgi:hypothetical protein
MCADVGGTKYTRVCVGIVISLYVLDLFKDAHELGSVAWNFMTKACNELNKGARNVPWPTLIFSLGIRLC